jgi:polyketide biosynthesis acyl carrier protein
MTGQAQPRDAVAALVRDVIGTILPGVPVSAMTEDQHLRELGADSVDRVEIVAAILDRLGLDEPMSSFSGLANLGALFDFLMTEKSPR